MCWFEAGVTKSSGTARTAAGLGLIPGSLCAHYHEEPERRLAYLTAVERGLPGGYGLDDYAGLLWSGARLAGAICARPGAGAYRVTASPGARIPGRAGGVTEACLTATVIESRSSGDRSEDVDELRRIRRLRPGPTRLG